MDDRSVRLQTELASDPSVQSYSPERREPRYPLSIDLEVTGTDSDGRRFCERTRTVEVSNWGCLFLISVAVPTASMVTLHVIGKQPHCIPYAPPVKYLVAYCNRY
jgi:hypothetical protein